MKKAPAEGCLQTRPGRRRGAAIGVSLKSTIPRGSVLAQLSTGIMELMIAGYMLLLSLEID
jgi:hypothetical protein